ncbi:hypothetical protein [Variovorax sp. KK3]|uniref:hypothetical protein n=1 Tax=Variovorax sp. KK3 TaxID=1855728 RepID=UPI00097BC463|nr:hypothetical protein [Variovorax sp. KK3]
MPIATPPPDIDPTIVPPAHKHPTDSQARETGVGSNPAKSPYPMTGNDKHVADLVKLWPEDRAASSFFLAWQLGH